MYVFFLTSCIARMRIIAPTIHGRPPCFAWAVPSSQIKSQTKRLCCGAHLWEHNKRPENWDGSCKIAPSTLKITNKTSCCPQLTLFKSKTKNMLCTPGQVHWHIECTAGRIALKTMYVYCWKLLGAQPNIFTS